MVLRPTSDDSALAAPADLFAAKLGIIFRHRGLRPTLLADLAPQRLATSRRTDDLDKPIPLPILDRNQHPRFAHRPLALSLSCQCRLLAAERLELGLEPPPH